MENDLLEKVIKGLRCLSDPYVQDMDERDCENCKYDNACCLLDVTADALELLKAQEPKKVRCIFKLTKVMKGICPTCEMTISSVLPYGKITKFCQYCGQAVKWE